MALPLLIPAALTLIDKLFPDANSANEAKLKILEMQQKGELAALEADMKLAQGQMEINKVEAATDGFRGGWRPAAGWVCVFGLFYTFLLRPLLPWIATALGFAVEPLPSIDTMELLALLGGMLGLGGYRTVERLKGKA